MLVLCFILAVPNAGIIWGSTIAYSAFLKQTGLGALPWVLVISSILSILALAVYSAFVDRVADDRLLLAIFIFGVICIVFGLGLILAGKPVFAYPVLYLLFLAWAAVANPHLVTYISSFYDVQSAKRIFPVVLAAGRTGAIIAGLTVPLLTHHLSFGAIVGIWLFTYLVAIAAIWLMPVLIRQKSSLRERASQSALAASPRQSRHPSSFVESIREGLKYVSQSSYLRWIAFGTLILMILMAFLEFQSSQLLAASFTTQSDFANFIGVLDGLANLFVLPMLLFGVSRLIARLGLANVSMFFPMANLLITVWLVFFPGLASASAAYFDRKALRTSLQLPIDSLLFNAVPVRIRGRARAFVSGLILPIGSLIGGLLLLLPLGKTIWLVSWLILLLAFAFLGAAFIIRRKYSQALVQMLQEEDYSFLLEQEASELPMADPATLRRLQTKLEAANSHELKVFMTRLITQIGGAQSVGILGPAIQSVDTPNTRAAMLDVLAASELRSDRLNELFAGFLTDPAAQVRQSAIAGLEQSATSADLKFINRMLEMVSDTDLAVSTRALTALAGSNNFYSHPQAYQALELLLNSQDPQLRERGVSVLAKIQQPAAALRLVEYLADPDDQVRMIAAIAIEEPRIRRADPKVERQVEVQLGKLVQDPVERVRFAALMVLGQVGTNESHQMLMEALSDPSPQVRASAVSALARAGKAIIPLVQPNLQSEDPQVRKMALVILSQVNPREFGSLVITQAIMGNLSIIYHFLNLAEGLAPASRFRSVAVLQAALREQSQRLAEEILYFLTAIHDAKAVAIIDESLNSENPRTRANATEALEALTTPQISRLVTPLFEPSANPDLLLEISQENWGMSLPESAGALRQIATNHADPWLQALGLFALGEIGVECIKRSGARTHAEIQSTAKSSDRPDRTEESTPARRQQRRGLDLLGSLTGEVNNQAEQSSTPLKATTAQSDSELKSPVIQEPLLDISEIATLLNAASGFSNPDVSSAVQAALKKIAAASSTEVERMPDMEEWMLSIIDRIIFLKEVPFFQDMTVDQLKILASVCEEIFYEKDTRIFNKDDAGGVLYVVVNGRVGIEQEKRAGSFARLGDVEAYSYFGEANFFDNSLHSTTAVAIVDTLCLQLHRDPLIALARQNPELSLKLINTLSLRLREANDRIADLTRSRPRELHKLFDQYE